MTPPIAAGQQKQRARQALLAAIEELIGQIGLEAAVACEDVRDESIRDRWLRAEQQNHLRFRDDEHLRGGKAGRALPPNGVSSKRLLTKVERCIFNDIWQIAYPLEATRPTAQS